MDLKDFITGTLVQIVEGVHAAQKQVSPLGGNVNPYEHYASAMGTHYKRGDVQSVSFDVAITAEENSTTKEGIGVVVATIALGKRNEKTDAATSVSRVQFTVPLALPDGENLSDTRHSK